MRETAELIEHGITAGGKRLRDRLEAVDYDDAVLWMRELHRRIVFRSQPEIGGIYSTLPRRINSNWCRWRGSCECSIS